MEKKMFSAIRFYGLIILSVTLQVFSSCKDKEDEKVTRELNQNASDTASFKMNCLVLTKAQVQTWVDSAGPKKLKTLLLQFHTSGSAGIKTNMQLIAYPGENINNAGAYGQTLLSIDTSCSGMPFTAATFPNNVTDLVDAGILDANGTVKDFDRVLFKPSGKFAPMLSFSIEVIKNNMTIMAKETNPCPPCQYCNPPCVTPDLPDM